MAVASYLGSVSGQLLAEFKEVESGARAQRPHFSEALKTCRIFGATLVIARLDRLARNVALTSALMESGVEFIAADFPEANRLTVHIIAAIAEYEHKLISERVKAAIAAKKARGEKWGSNLSGTRWALDIGRPIGHARMRQRAKARALDLAPLLYEMREAGKSEPQICAELDRMGIRTPRAKNGWYREAVRTVFILGAEALPQVKIWNRQKKRFEATAEQKAA